MERAKYLRPPNKAEYTGSVSGLGASQEVAVHAARPYVKVHSVCGVIKDDWRDNTAAADTAETQSSDLVEAENVEVQLVADKAIPRLIQ